MSRKSVISPTSGSLRGALWRLLVLSKDHYQFCMLTHPCKWNYDLSVKTETVGQVYIHLKAKAEAVPLHTTKVLEGEEVEPLLILNLGARWGEWSA
jgi:hypothetical protein